MLVLLMQKFLCEAVRLLTVAIILDISITTITMTTTTTTSIIVNYYFYYYIWLWTICRWFKSLQVHWVGRNLVPTVESPERKWDRSLTRWHFWGLMTKKYRVFLYLYVKVFKIISLVGSMNLHGHLIHTFKYHLWWKYFRKIELSNSQITIIYSKFCSIKFQKIFFKLWFCSEPFVNNSELIISALIIFSTYNFRNS